MRYHLKRSVSGGTGQRVPAMLRLVMTLMLGSLLSRGAHAHTKILYPGQRGDNLLVTEEFPYGMQRVYPCGGLPSANRVPYSLPNGAISIAPGYFTNHKVNTIYISLRLGSDSDSPDVESQPLVPGFKIWGPSNQPYPDVFCLPSIAGGADLKEGDEATIQVVQVLESGGAMYNCVDIVIAPASEVAGVNATNCYNSTGISFKDPSLPDATLSSTGESSIFTTRPTGTRSGLFASTSTSSSACGAATSACPTGNGVQRRGAAGMGIGEKMGWGVGGLVLGMLGL
ncbi:hypothetical protein B0O99DRAFT_561695 [Bisporella sp. PMI_857]|nr:hypothetical protein B0O99DRAFT_561695 [Bisporella sp. PMI_857]